MKKLISIFFIIVIAGTVSVYANAPMLTENQKKDLKQYGIMVGDENGSLHLENAITRSEMAKIICTAMNIKTYDTESKCVFTDVNSDYWAYKYICAANALDIINGYDDGSFRPEEKVSNEEAIKMIVCMIGYGMEAETNGGYPAGYMAVASRRGVLNDAISFGIDVPSVRNDIGVLVYNALDIPLMKENDGMYVIMDGEMYPKETLRENFK